MNIENLFNAFGEIDEEIFGENLPADFSGEEETAAVEPVFVVPSENGIKKGRSKKPLLIAASAAAACGVFAAGIGTVLNNYTEVTPPNNSQITAYDSKTVFPDLEFSEEYRELYNAEDLYCVERTTIDPEAARGFSPQLVDGDLFYFTTFYGPYSEAEIILYDSTSKEEKVLYSFGGYDDYTSPDLNLIGIYDSYLYFVERVSADEAAKFCRLNLTDYTCEVISLDDSSIWLNFTLSEMNNFVLSEKENCIYFYYCYGLSYLDSLVSQILRYDLSSGKTELFMENASRPMAYKDGIIYKKDGDFYYHSSKEADDIVLFADDYGDLKALGGELLFYTDITYDNNGYYQMSQLEARDDSGKKTLITTEKESGFYLYDFTGTKDGLVLCKADYEKPVIYDYKENKFSFIDGGYSHYLPISPLGFADSGGVSFLGAKYDKTEGKYTGLELVTIKRKADDNSDNSQDIDDLLQGEIVLPKQELYTAEKEVLSAEELYEVRKYELYSTKSFAADSDISLDPMLAGFKKNTSYNDTWVYYHNGSLYFNDTNTIYQYRLSDTSKFFISSEEVETAENEGKDLQLKIGGIYDGIIYYYKIENNEITADTSEQKISLWACEVSGYNKFKIADLEANHDFKLQPLVKAGNCVYFVDIGLGITSSEEDHTKIYRYDTDKLEVELFKDKASYPVICSYKNGIVYYALGLYCNFFDGTTDTPLENYDLNSKISASGDKIFYAQRGEYVEFNTLVGVYEDDFTAKELGLLPSYTTYGVNDIFTVTGGKGLTCLDIQYSSQELRLPQAEFALSSGFPDIRTEDKEEILLYDSERDNGDCFSSLTLPEGDRVVCAAAAEEGLIIFTADRDNSRIDYYTVCRNENTY